LSTQIDRAHVSLSERCIRALPQRNNIK